MNPAAVPNLERTVDALETSRHEIAAAWVSLPAVQAVFKARKISPEKFRDGYGVPIIEYFIAVVRREREAGDCPVMSRLVYFLLDKQITPQNVFDICMGFRRCLIRKAFEAGWTEGCAPELMDEIAELFDANLSGVLEIFGRSYAAQQEKLYEVSAQQKKFKQILQVINCVDTKILIVENGRILLANQPFFRIVGAKDLQDFYKKYPDGWGFVNGVDSDPEGFEAEHIEAWLDGVYERDKPFKVQIYHHAIGKNFTYSGRITALPDSDPLRYIVAFSNIDTHLTDYAQQLERLRHDELTNLWSYTWFEHLLGEARREAVERKTRLALAVVDVPDLARINEKQGREAGDRVLMEVTADIALSAESSMITARLEGSRFGILMECMHPQHCYDWCAALQMRLAKKAERKTVALTAFDLADTTNRLLLRAYELVDAANGSDSDAVQTDIEGLELHDTLPDQEQFTLRLSKMVQVPTTFYYKGLPVSAKSRLLEVHKSEVTIELVRKQLAVAREHEPLYLNVPPMGYVRAQVMRVDPKKMTARVAQFRSDCHSPLGRKRFRVDAPEGMQLHITHDEETYDGTVLDMNDRYIAFKTPRKKRLEAGSSIGFSMMLQSDASTEQLTTFATVDRIEKIKGGYKVVALCHLRRSEVTLLERYIAQRQMAIIQELRRREA